LTQHTVIIIQARMGSTRLPGKVFKTVAGKSLLAHQLARVEKVQGADRMVVACTEHERDDVIAEFCEREGVCLFRGSEEDVLSRYHGAAEKFGATVVVRLTSDCPLMDATVVDAVIDKFNQGGYDYVSNTINRSFPRGLDVEVFSRKALDIAQKQATEPSDREHVTPFIYRQPEKFTLGDVFYSSDQSHHRWTVDTPEDFLLISKVIEALYPKDPGFRMEEVLALLERHPDWATINAHIEQKKVEEV